MDDVIYWLKFLNVLLCAALFGQCLVKVNWRKVIRPLNSMNAGLAVLAFGVGWSQTYRLYEGFHPWVPLYTLGLCLSLYGMSKYNRLNLIVLKNQSDKTEEIA